MNLPVGKVKRSDPSQITLAIETPAALITTTKPEASTTTATTETTTTVTTETTTATSTEETTSTTTEESTTTTETTTTLATTAKPEPEVTKPTTTTKTTTTTTTQTPIFTSTEMPNGDQGKIPQGDQPRCKKLVKADIVFGLHGIGGEDRESVREFIKVMGSGFDLKSGNFKLGLKENCKNLQLSPTEFGDNDDYMYAVQDVMELGLKPLLLHTKRAFRYSRRRADRIAILLISGTVQDMAHAYRVANGLKRMAKIIVIGVGGDTDTEQLKGLASYRDKTEPDISHVFPVIEPKNLPYIVKKLHKLMCSEQQQ